ncbi:MAG: aldehyde dehydrogenase family protein [Streptosporangiaceae bacterium]
MPERYGLWIAGVEEFDDGRETAAVVDPYAGKAVAEVEQARPADVDRVVASAVEAFHAARDEPGHVRAGRLRAVAGVIEEHAAELADTLVRTIGKPRPAALAEARRGAAVARLCAEEIVRFGGETLPVDGLPGGEGRWSLTFREPYGVAAVVTPFNAPINLLVQKLAPALAVGDAVVVKPSPEGAPLTNQLARLLADRVPAGLVNVVHGGPDVVGHLVAHPDAAVVSLTGGVEAGRSVLARAGVKPVFLELGSNSPNIVLADADLDDAATRIAAAAFKAGGQQCISAQRIFVHADVVHEFTDRIVAAARRLVVGDPSEEATDLGPVVHDRAATRVRDMISDAEERGAKVLLDGRGRDSSNLRLLGPTLLADVPDGAALLRDEVFGPVAILQRVEGLDAAIADANRVEGILQASCFTRSLGDATRAARELHAGSVWINEPTRFRLDVYPFGGYGQSGVGREGIRYAMEAFSQVKHVGIRAL